MCIFGIHGGLSEAIESDGGIVGSRVIGGCVAGAVLTREAGGRVINSVSVGGPEVVLQGGHGRSRNSGLPPFTAGHGKEASLVDVIVSAVEDLVDSKAMHALLPSSSACVMVPYLAHRWERSCMLLMLLYPVTMFWSSWT
jgi:hypothetical protein